ncbi:MAG: GH3 auxin-responsive promoter family protein, partial [Bacteroidales bacterium]|nr:GH3 auxin-responsive promoter family protein [Bacteroidales bacterium]
TEAVDAALKYSNMEYKAKRESLRLKDAVTYRLQFESFEHFKEECIKEGARDGQFKLNLLLQDEKRQAKFNKLVK